MSEHLSPSHPEKSRDSEASFTPEKSHHKELEPTAEQQEKAINQPSVEQLQSAVEHLAISGKEQSPFETEQPKSHHPMHINKHLKNMSYSRTLIRVRKRLPLPSRTLSRIVHTPVVDAVSEFSSKTVARPSGMLGGALFACIGTTIVLWITKRYGYEYNYLVVAFLFLGGMFIGLGVEALYKLNKKVKNNLK